MCARAVDLIICSEAKEFPDIAFFSQFSDISHDISCFYIYRLKPHRCRQKLLLYECQFGTIMNFHTNQKGGTVPPWIGCAEGAFSCRKWWISWNSSNWLNKNHLRPVSVVTNHSTLSRIPWSMVENATLRLKVQLHKGEKSLNFKDASQVQCSWNQIQNVQSCSYY